MKKIYAILNLLAIVGVIFWNYLSNTGFINGTTVGELSDKYANLFTPAGCLGAYCNCSPTLGEHSSFTTDG